MIWAKARNDGFCLRGEWVKKEGHSTWGASGLMLTGDACELELKTQWLGNKNHQVLRGRIKVEGSL